MPETTIRPLAKRRRLLANHCRAEVLWGLGFFVVAQLLMTLALQDWWPQLHDPEYGRRLNSLRARLSEEPGRPLVVALGSSRMAMGLRPEFMPAHQANDGAPVVFNFALVGAGPVTQLMCLNRLLDDGIHPDGIVLELWVPLLHPGLGKEVNRLDPRRLEDRDLPLLIRYGAKPDYLHDNWWRSRLAPAFEHRLNLMSQFFPGWLPYNYRQDVGYRGLDGWGWLPNKRPTQQFSDDEFVRLMEPFRKQYEPMFHEFKLCPTADRALHELLELCREKHITVACVIMPEGSVVRRWYGPHTDRNFSAYLGQLHREFGITTIDARSWVADDGFRDGYHLHLDGAADFTRHFLDIHGLDALTCLQPAN